MELQFLIIWVGFLAFYNQFLITLDLELFENLNGLLMEESVYIGWDTKF